MAQQENQFDYIELPLVDVQKTKAFFSSVFGWQFQDWADTYISFSGAGLDGGFNGERKPNAAGNGPLIVLYSDQLEEKLTAVQAASGPIVREIFQFPGGRRFHFLDPNGNEFAVWSQK